MALQYLATVQDISIRVGGKEKVVKKGTAAPKTIDDQVRDALVGMGLLTATEVVSRASSAAAAPGEGDASDGQESENPAPGA